MKKQVKKFSKKIMVFVLATSIIFTTCFSYKKINAHATGAVAALGAYTLYEICLYIGGLAVTTLGIGYAYENRDEIAEFGKSVIDTMSDLPTEGWILGSHTTEGDYVYGTEALKEVQNTAWSIIQGGGNSPKNDNDGDGDKDQDDIIHTINLNGYFLLEKGVELFLNHIKPLYDSWVNKEEDISNNPIYNQYGSSDASSYFDPNNIEHLKNDNGDYVWLCTIERTYLNYAPSIINFEIHSPEIAVAYSLQEPGVSSEAGVFGRDGSITAFYINGEKKDVAHFVYGNFSDFKVIITSTNMPILSSYEQGRDYRDGAKNFEDYSVYDVQNLRKNYTIADWIAEDDTWKGHLEDIATSLRSLQDLTNIAQQLANGALTTQPSADAYGDMMVNLGNEYAPETDPITDPVYWPATNPTPVLDPSVFPNYQPSVVPDPDPGTNPDNPDDGEDDVPEIDLDGLLSIFNILFYLIMIIIMLIYLFLSCLAFIVMIFRIPASSTMLPEDMVLGYEHLKTIMIPGMNISIYGFAMALIYLFIIFAVIKLIRLEINDFKFPRSYK